MVLNTGTKQWHSLVAGGVAGAVDTCITMPLDTIKTQMQIHKYPSAMQCARQIANQSGVSGLYSGFKPFLVQASGKAAVRFFSYRAMCRVVDSVGIDRAQNSGVWSAICGFGAGMTEALVWTTPSERLKVLQQAAAANGKPPAVSVLIKQTGLRGLYVGAVPTAMRQASGVAVRFATHDNVKRALKSLQTTKTIPDPNNPGHTITVSTPLLSSAATSFLGGGIGGAVSVVLNNPIDVVKSRIQAGYKGGMLACMKEVWQQGGLWAFTAGLSVRVPRLFMSQAIQFMIFDAVVEKLQDY